MLERESKKHIVHYAYSVAILLFVFSHSSYAAVVNVSGLNLESFLTHLSTQIPQLMRLVTAIAYVMGIYLIIMGIIKFKHFGESRTMMSEDHSIKGPLILLAVGAALLYLPTSVWVGLGTVGLTESPYAYKNLSSSNPQWNAFLKACFLIVQLIGTIAFIRGLVILSRLGERSSQQDTLSKGLVHILGGVLCINIYQFISVIASTFGIQWSWTG